MLAVANTSDQKVSAIADEIDPIMKFMVRPCGAEFPVVQFVR